MSLERHYQLVTGGRSFPKMSSALREVSGQRGGWSLGLLCCHPEPLLPAGTSLVHDRLCPAAAPALRAPSESSEPLRGLQRPSPGREGRATGPGWGAAAPSLLGCCGSPGAVQAFAGGSARAASAHEGRARHGCGAPGQALPAVPSLPERKRGAVLVPARGSPSNSRPKAFRWEGVAPLPCSRL